MPKTVILSAARTPIGKLGGGLSSLDATSLGATAIAAALERAEVAPDEVQHVVMGQVLQAGQGQIPSRQAQIKAGIPKEVTSETINKVCASGIRAAGMIDAIGPRGRPRRRGRGRYGIDVECALPAQAGPVRLPDGRRQDARRDDRGRSEERLERASDVRRGDRGRRRAGADPPRPGPLGAALASAGDQGDGRGSAGRRDRAGHGQDAQGRDGRRGRRGAAPRHEPRDARQAPGAGQQGGLAHGRQLAGRQRRRRCAGARLRRVGGRARQAGAGDDHRAGARSPTTSPTWRGPRPRRRRRRWRRSA